MSIGNDREFKDRLSSLSVAQQRVVAARFAENVQNLSSDPRVIAAVNSAKRPDISDAELGVVFQAAKSASVESYTQCGKEADWGNQAGHFIAEAAMICVRPAERAGSLAWDVAMAARMARTCATIATGQGTENREAQQQYRILDEFLNQ